MLPDKAGLDRRGWEPARASGLILFGHLMLVSKTLRQIGSNNLLLHCLYVLQRESVGRSVFRAAAAASPLQSVRPFADARQSEFEAAGRIFDRPHRVFCFVVIELKLHPHKCIIGIRASYLFSLAFRYLHFKMIQTPSAVQSGSRVRDRSEPGIGRCLPFWGSVNQPFGDERPLVLGTNFELRMDPSPSGSTV